MTVEDLSDSERELAAAAAEVVAANREFEKFIDVAAHDLRAPLRILTGFADALDDECAGTLTEDGATFLQGDPHRRRAHGRHHRRPALARALEPRGDALRVTRSRRRWSSSCTTSCAIRRSKREVQCEVAPDLVAWGDVRLMMTALRALLGNAWKFTGRTAQASMRFHAEQRDGRTWFCVTDNGAGFDMAHAARLFKPFTRLHRQDEFPGHGMGLATAQVIVRRHGGSIEAESAPGAGTTVRFAAAPRDRNENWRTRAPRVRCRGSTRIC